MIGGTGHVYLADYEFGEEIILLDYVIGSAADFTTSYDFSTDYTAVTFKDGADTLEDRIFIKGNVKVAGTESTTFTNAALTGSSDPTLNNATADTRLILERSTDVPAETIIGGEGDDYIIGEGGAEQIRTGGGNDTVFAGGGDDLVVVQGQGDSTVDTGAGDDKVVVSNDWSGTLLLKSGAGADDGAGNSLEIQKEIKGSGAVNDTDMFITFSDGSQITVEDYYSIDAEGYYIVNDASFQSVRIGGWDSWEDYRDGTTDWVVGTANSDKLYSPAINDTAEAGIIYSLSGRGGDDILYSGGGNNAIWGGEGDDTFYLSGDAQQTVIGGDKESSRSAGGPGDLPIVIGENISFADSVYLEWQKSEVTLSNPREGYFRIEHAGTGSVVDIYDVENLYFSDGSGGYEYKPLTEGQVIGKAHWQGEAAGMDIEYEQHNVSFQVDGDILKVLASATVTVTEEQFETITLWTLGMVILTGEMIILALICMTMDLRIR